MKEIVIYGGSFNPLHNGHDTIIRQCTRRREYDAVWVMPSAKRYDKPNLIDDEVRLDMLHQYHNALPQAIAAKVVISDFEVELGAPSETVRTHTALVRQYRGYNFTYVFGADALAGVRKWRGGASLLQDLTIVAVTRDGNRPEGIQLKNVIELEGTDTISSTTIRKLRRCKQPIQRYVPTVIATYIHQHALYE